MSIDNRIYEALKKIGYSPSVTFKGNVGDLRQRLNEIRGSGTAEDVTWQDLIYAIAIEIDNVRDMQEFENDGKAIHSLPYVAEAFIPNIGDSYDHYLVSFAHNRDGLCDLHLGRGRSTFETVMGIRETDRSSFLLFRDRFGLMMPQTRELCYFFKDGEPTGQIKYLFLGKPEEYPEEKSKPISEHLFPHMFSRYMKSCLPAEFKRYFKSCIPDSQRPLTSSDWEEKTIQVLSRDAGGKIMKTYTPKILWERM